MSKNYRKLWVFGDSYSTPDVYVAPADSFWGLTAARASIPAITNCSSKGNSLDSVSHLLISIQNKIDWTNDLIFVGIPPLERITVVGDDQQQICQLDTANWTKEWIDNTILSGTTTLQNYGEDRVMVLHSNRSWTETQALQKIFLLTAWLDSKQANYLILNLSKPFDPTDCLPSNEFLLPYTKNHSRCILFTDTYQSINIDINQPVDYNKYGWNGHHGSAGNLRFFEKSLWPKLKECNLC